MHWGPCVGAPFSALHLTSGSGLGAGAGGSEPETGVHRGLLRMDALPDVQRRKGIDPHVHQVVEQPGGVRPALQRLPGQLEEERTEGAGGVHDVIPEESGLLVGIEFALCTRRSRALRC